jgi:tRNA-specific adenosine deaminase 1
MQALIKQFNSLSNSGKPADDQFTVLAGIVINDKAVALATGLSCLNYLKVSDQGESVNDCHAEVLCVRSFRAYLYHQIMYAIKNEESILEYDQSRNPPFRLVKGTLIHFYISQAPCGDASMDMLEDRQTEEETLRNRSKLLDSNARIDQFLSNENVFGTVHRGRMDYSIRGVARTKPGRIDSIPTESMSCSDKILLWNILGLSGALLSLLIEPIYLSSITVADCNEDLLNSSLFGRIKGMQVDFNFPEIYSSAQQFRYSWAPNKIPCPTAIAWNPADGSQVIDQRGMKLGTSLKSSKKNRPFVSSLELFSRFSNFASLLDIELGGLGYDQVKRLNVNYQKSKELAISKLVKGWIKKRTVLNFYVPSDKEKVKFKSYV